MEIVESSLSTDLIHPVVTSASGCRQTDGLFDIKDFSHLHIATVCKTIWVPGHSCLDRHTITSPDHLVASPFYCHNFWLDWPIFQGVAFYLLA